MGKPAEPGGTGVMMAHEAGSSDGVDARKSSVLFDIKAPARTTRSALGR